MDIHLGEGNGDPGLIERLLGGANRRVSNRPVVLGLGLTYPVYASPEEGRRTRDYVN